MMERPESGALQEAIGVLRSILSSPETITTLSSSLGQQRPTSSTSTIHSAVENEVSQLFRPSNASQWRQSTQTQGQSTGTQQSLRYQTQRHFGKWSSQPRKRSRIQYHDTFHKDIILLPKPSSCIVVKHKAKQELHDKGHVVYGFEFCKSWDQITVMDHIREAFSEKLSSDVSLECLMSCGNKLISPKLRAGQELDANLIHRIYKSKALYIRPSRQILDDMSGYSSDDNCEESISSTRQLRSSSQGRPHPRVESAADSFTSTVSACTQNGSLSSSSLQSSSSVEGSSSLSISDCGTGSSLPSMGLTTACHLQSTSTHQQSDNYGNYLSVVAALSDLSSDDEELNQAIQASLETERCNPECSVPAREILQELATKINHQKTCKFNIHRATVLDGAIRGFKRGTYDPCHTIYVKFSDDTGVPEEAVDLGGPKREFLRLLMEALLHSSMFEGEGGKMNLALDSTAMREDRYFIAGRTIAVSLVHGGPPAGFLSPTLYSCLVDGPEFVKPVLEDVADRDLRAKIKKVTECQSFEDLLTATEPLEEYLANAGCLRQLKRLEDKDLLVDDVLMFQVIHRVRGPFERFRDGLRTLGVLDKIQAYPESFRPLLCWCPSVLSADMIDTLFTIRFSPVGTNKRNAEEMVIPFWRDYLSDAEEQAGTQKLEVILAFATGASTVPAIGFFPQPSIEFLHHEAGSVTVSKFPIANTCINCLKLPLHTSYKDFQEHMDFALGNTHGFGIA